MANVKLTITVTAERMDDDLPGAYEANVDKTIELVMPYVDPKFVSLPKVIEGVTIEALTEHREKIASVKAAAEARRPGPLWNGVTMYPRQEQAADDEGE